MPRAKGLSVAALRVQEDLDCIQAALVGWEISAKLMRLRIEQARQRSGLAALIDPALDELAVMHCKIRAAHRHISKARARLVEK